MSLSVSLHAPNDEIRQRIMPVARRWSLDELLSACREYTKITSRRITYEYSMIENVNDSLECAGVLAEKLKGTSAMLTLFLNRVEGIAFSKSSRKRIEDFKYTLKSTEYPLLSEEN